MNSAVRVRAFAKINLSLRVLGIRADGYHELRTIFQTIALHDTLTIRARRGPFVLRCDDPSCPADQTNLVWRAADAVWAASRRRGPLRDLEISLVKRIPMQAGLGGGSSDAAATLRALATLWRVKDAAVTPLALALGADVPYFLEGGTVLGLDRGDLLYPLADYPPAWVTLVLPDFGVSTVEAYRWWDEQGGAPRGSADGGVNDLQPPVAARHPEIVRDRRPPRAGWCISRRDVRQRIGRVWPVYQPRRRGAGCPRARRPDAPRAPDPHRESHGLSTTCRDRGPSYKLTVCAAKSGPLLRSRQVSNRQLRSFRRLARSHAVRGGGGPRDEQYWGVAKR